MHIKTVKRFASGAFCQVYEALMFPDVDDSTLDSEGKPIALKLSHITRYTENPMLRHEASVLAICAGHPAFPKVYAYGRSQYFEYLAMDLLGTSLQDVVRKHKRLNLRSGLLVIDQMLDALQHLHSHNLIQRDVKPDNFLLGTGENAGRLYMIDFGFARYFRDPTTNLHRPLTEKESYVGTFKYSSLNTHLELTPSRRDDLESLVYCIAFMMQGSLPWDCISSGTSINREMRYRQKKRTWTGSRLFEGFPKEFADFADYVRNLQYEEDPDYDHWKATFTGLFNSLGFSYEPGFDIELAGVDDVAEEEGSDEPPPKLGPPIEKGQYILARIVPSTSIDGFPEPQDESRRYDLSLRKPEWQFPFRPFLVAEVDPTPRHWASLIPLFYKPGGLTDEEKERFVRVGGSLDHEELAEERVVVPSPMWDLQNMYHAGPLREFRTVVSGSENIVQTHWKLDEGQLQRLIEFLKKPPTKLSDEAQNLVHDLRKLTSHYGITFYSEVEPFTPAHADITSIDPETLIGTEGISWSGHRGFVNEQLQLHRRYCAENYYPWPEDKIADEEEEDEDDFSDDDFFPQWTFDRADCVPKEDVLGDWKVILKGVVILTEVPEMHEKVIYNDNEKMIAYD